MNHQATCFPAESLCWEGRVRKVLLKGVFMYVNCTMYCSQALYHFVLTPMLSCSITNTAPLVHSSASFLCFPQNSVAVIDTGPAVSVSVATEKCQDRSRQSLLKVFVASLEHWNERQLQGTVSSTPAAWVGSCSTQRKYVPGHNKPVTHLRAH